MSKEQFICFALLVFLFASLWSVYSFGIFDNSKEPHYHSFDFTQTQGFKVEVKLPFYPIPKSCKSQKDYWIYLHGIALGMIYPFVAINVEHDIKIYNRMELLLMITGLHDYYVEKGNVPLFTLGETETFIYSHFVECENNINSLSEVELCYQRNFRDIIMDMLTLLRLSYQTPLQPNSVSPISSPSSVQSVKIKSPVKVGAI